jgi:hypothetical protein
MHRAFHLSGALTLITYLPNLHFIPQMNMDHTITICYFGNILNIAITSLKTLHVRVTSMVLDDSYKI